ncbi:hypothetical protein AS038_05400 [Arthrobacter sp. NIO-1057]|nr:hypothetical protein AS038_05400 [Arthrobacter sp. NIO-1057]SCC00365.1 hypothetical protein GA0061084_1093 [Arthrobacter sp. NIO-1057]
MHKKIVVSAAVIALGLSMLTGCSSGKLSTEETCTLLTEKAKELDLANKTESAVQDILAGDDESFTAAINEVTAFLQEAADKTKDQKLAEALQVSIKQNNQMVDLLSDKDLSLADKISKTQSNTVEDTEKMAYVSTACPELDELGN